ncbi:hypothetical protein AAFF_G00223500 [Aldrovandia affinis]|uniref:SKI family transcriptional corepressor 1 n=1 Tax=Aldrovandia affinis TaxID=143900 RepID=A0AAD7X1Z7_9TELE|nr:hypothetical protein AAFF_G00223500 [Aldrovandia affinis]
MFNGGSRKRTLPMCGTERSSSLKPQGSGGVPQRRLPEVPLKTLRSQEDQGTLNLANGVRSYPVIPVPSKHFGMLQKLPPPLFPHPYGFPAFGLCQKKDDSVGLGEHGKTNLSGVFWPGAKDSVYPSFPMFWPSTGGLPLPPYPQPQPKLSVELMNARQHELDVSEQSDRSASTPKDSAIDSERSSSSHSTRNEDDKSGDEARSIDGGPIVPRKMNYISAFRPVVKDAESIAKLHGNRETYNGARSGHLSPDFISESSSYRSVSPDVDSAEEPDVDVESNREHEDEDSVQLSMGERQIPPAAVFSHAGQDKWEEAETNSVADTDEARRLSSEAGSTDLDGQRKEVSKGNDHGHAHEEYAHERDDHVLLNAQSTFGSTANYHCGSRDSSDPHKEESPKTAESVELKTLYQDPGSVSKGSPREPVGCELQKQLVEQVELRKKLEREFQSLKDTFQDQMKRELSYREEMVQQLQIVRDTLCSELDQERTARYAIQQKLKEAHEGLHHFSCKMLTPRHCTGTCSFKPPLMPP